MRLRFRTNKLKADYYYDFKSILHVKYSLIEKRRLKPLHKTCMKEYMTLVKESQTLDEKMRTSDNIDEELQYELDKICMQREELFQALMDSNAISDE